MSLSFCVLGSGSGGNSTLVICGPPGDASVRKCFLVDCGLSPRATAKRMAPLGVTLDEISAILLTHFDTDHFYPGWLKMIQKRNLPVHAHKRHRNAAWAAGLTAREVSLFNGSLDLDCGVQASTMLMAHDDLGSVSFVLDHAGCRLGYATDVGCVPKSLFDHFSGLHALAIESNYDREMQLASGRPIYLKRRIMGGSGHLSNVQSLEAVRLIADASPLSHIALLHLSRQCNDPDLVRELYLQYAPDLLDRLTITEQFEASPLLEVRKLPHVCAKTHRPALTQLIDPRPSSRPSPQLNLFAE